jgi:hypothetical protein
MGRPAPRPIGAYSGLNIGTQSPAHSGEIVALLRVNLDEIKKALREELVEEMREEIKAHVDSRLDKFQKSQQRVINQVDGRIGPLVDRKDKATREYVDRELKKCRDDVAALMDLVEGMERSKGAAADRSREALEAAAAANDRMDRIANALLGGSPSALS